MENRLYAAKWVGLALALALGCGAWAQLIPPGINHQGMVNVNGDPFTGTGQFYFALAMPDGLGGLSNLWTSDGSQMYTSNRPDGAISLTVTEGHYSVSLGDGMTTNGMDYTIFNTSGGALFLRVWFNDGTNGIQKLNPDQPISSVPYAFTAQRLMASGTGSNLDADLLDGQHAASFAVSTHTHAASAITSGTIADERIPSGIARLYQIIYQMREDDGSGSGLDADLLDGLHAASFAASSHSHGAADITGGTLDDARLPSSIARDSEVVPAVLAADGAGSNLDADLLDGKHANQLWSTTGNGGTTPGTNYIGTSDNNAVEIKVNNTRAMRIEPVSSPNLIGGHNSNWVTSGVYGATIAGGGSIGRSNRVTDSTGTVGGGENNQAGDNGGTTLDKAYATVGGGFNNSATGSGATIGGGSGNIASGISAFIGCGESNRASGDYAVVVGGAENRAGGKASFAAGSYARAMHDGCFVWVDSSETDTSSTAANQFRVRSSGGIWFYSSTGNVGATLAAGSGTWTSISDRNEKENFSPVNCGEVLDKVSKLPVSTWNYKTQDPSIRHMGPMAQDLYAAFGMGESDTGITTLDADGIALAAIQGLNQRLDETTQRMADKDREIAALREELEALKSVVKGLAAQ